MRVRLGHGLANSHSQASMTNGGLAFRFAAAGADLNGSLAFGALLPRRCGLAHFAFFIAPTTSFCSSRPTKRPSEVVMGAFSSLCSIMKFAIS